ncbi:MAG: hypothetical protein H0T49_00155 [Chloroflexia bacterium]|nr:hypothetical protein [Chloroflexia bacterium]
MSLSIEKLLWYDVYVPRERTSTDPRNWTSGYRAVMAGLMYHVRLSGKGVAPRTGRGGREETEGET